MIKAANSTKKSQKEGCTKAIDWAHQQEAPNIFVLVFPFGPALLS